MQLDLASAAPDEDTRVKLIDLPRIVSDWVEPYGGLAGRRILDFGCGFGELAAGLAGGFDPAVVVGIDIAAMPLLGIKRFESWMGPGTAPPNLKLEQVEAGDLGSLDTVDVIVSWSAIEHVTRGTLDEILKGLHRKLSSGGLMMIQIAPLYFSPSGAHLWACGYGPWDHLKKSSSEVLADIAACAALNQRQREAVSQMFLELNRLTAPELVDLLDRVGFQLLRQQIDRVDITPPIELARAYTQDALTTEQVVLLLQKGET